MQYALFPQYLCKSGLAVLSDQETQEEAPPPAEEVKEEERFLDLAKRGAVKTLSPPLDAI